MHQNKQKASVKELSKWLLIQIKFSHRAMMLADIWKLKAEKKSKQK